MVMYSVADVSKMLNVNEETIRRWIRDGKLNAIRAVGRGGNTIFLEDVVNFANKPPRAYLIFLEEWLNSAGVPYERIEDSKVVDEAKALGKAAVLGKAGAATVSVITAATIPASLSVAGIASEAAMAGPVGMGVAGIAYGAAKLAKRKNQRTYSIRLLTSSEAKSTTTKVAVEKDAPSSQVGTESEPFLIEELRENQELNNSEAAECNVDDVPEEMPDFFDPASVLNKIAQAKQLLDAEIITQEEFAAIKARLIAKI